MHDLWTRHNDPGWYSVPNPLLSISPPPTPRSPPHRGRTVAPPEHKTKTLGLGKLLYHLYLHRAHERHTWNRSKVAGLGPGSWVLGPPALRIIGIPRTDSRTERVIRRGPIRTACVPPVTAQLPIAPILMHGTRVMLRSSAATVQAPDRSDNGCFSPCSAPALPRPCTAPSVRRFAPGPAGFAWSVGRGGGIMLWAGTPWRR